MLNKKLFFAFLMFFMGCLTLSAQVELGWDWRDSARISLKKLPQFNEFVNNQYPYPAQPRSQWEVGIGLGASSIVGDIRSNLGFGATATLRKAFNHTFFFSCRIGR